MITTSYGQNDLSDAKIKENIRDADVEEMQSIFDRAMPKRYDRIDTDLSKNLQTRVEALESQSKKPEPRAA